MNFQIMYWKTYQFVDIRKGEIGRFCSVSAGNRVFVERDGEDG